MKASKWQLTRITGTEARLHEQIKGIGAESYALRMYDKGCGFAARVVGLSCPAANILKQEALASGADAIVARGVINCSIERSDALIVGAEHSVRILAVRLARQQFGLAMLGRQLEQMLDGATAAGIQIKGDLLPLDKTYVMGILNITPDSFSDGGKYMTVPAALARAKQIIDEGATFIDIGAVSTRPDFTPPSEDEECSRLEPVIEAVAKLAADNGLYLSLDSWRIAVIEKYIHLVDLINDQNGKADSGLAALAAANNCAYCIMASDSNPADSLYHEAQNAEKAGLTPEQIILDPGFGFGKDVAGNYASLRQLPELASLGYPVLVGVSRKSMIKAAVGHEPEGRIYGSIAAETLAAVNGAHIIRTHAVAACVDAMNVVQWYKNI
ncbi:MAG: dihydropteroate synthase [Deferribacteraceae bacterium]|jgi:dihydropteroate synthase|nr:dihydropteroate synthase [Deferribacteraceae bacterium]